MLEAEHPDAPVGKVAPSILVKGRTMAATTPEPTSAAPDDASAEVPPVETLSAEIASVDTAEAPGAVATPTVVFVAAPTPPRTRGARGVGVLVAVLGAGLYTAVYAGLVLLLALLTAPAGTLGALRYMATPTFWIPVIVFALAYVLLVVVVNRAGWWAHVLGGFLVAVIVWVGFVGAAIIAVGALGAPAEVVGVVVAEQLTNPLGFGAAIAAREVPIWVGWIVARRGRTARARNQAARAAYEQELAEHRSTVGGQTAV